MVSLPKNVTRIGEGRGTYMTAGGEEKEAFAKLYLSLISRLHGSTAAEWEIAIHVLEATRFDGLPKRISIRQFMEVCHISNSAVQEGIARLVDRGLLYEEREPDGQSIRYALIDSSCPDFFSSEQEGGTLAVMLLGGIHYPIPESVLFFSTLNSPLKRIGKQYRSVLKNSTPRTGKQYSSVLKSSTEPSHQPRQREAPRDPREFFRESSEIENSVPGADAPIPSGTSIASSDSHTDVVVTASPLFPGVPGEPLPLPAHNGNGDLPPRQAGEKDRDYWLRITTGVSEQTVIRRITECAHRKLGVPRESASYARIGRLLKQYKLPFIIRRILNLSGEVIDDNPLNYLTKVLGGQQRYAPQGSPAPDHVDLSKVPGFAQPGEHPRRFVNKSAYDA